MGTRLKWRIQENRKTSRKSSKDNKFPPLRCYNWKTDVWNEYTKTKGLYRTSKYLICERLSENAPGSFNDTFHTSKLPLNHTTRSSSTYQLKVNNFKTERYGCKSIVNKCTLDWNNFKKNKQNFQMMKRSDPKTNIKNYFLKHYNDQKRLKIFIFCSFIFFLSGHFSLCSSSFISLFFLRWSVIFLSCVFLPKINICL